jgi:UDP-N-acetylmuramoyl-tripeptide--D-alanyl-D-alanine ligase
MTDARADLVVALGADAVGIADGARAFGRRPGEESVHVPNRVADLPAAHAHRREGLA